MVSVPSVVRKKPLHKNKSTTKDGVWKTMNVTMAETETTLAYRDFAKSRFSGISSPNHHHHQPLEGRHDSSLDTSHGPTDLLATDSRSSSYDEDIPDERHDLPQTSSLHSSDNGDGGVAAAILASTVVQREAIVCIDEESSDDNDVNFEEDGNVDREQPETRNCPSIRIREGWNVHTLLSTLDEGNEEDDDAFRQEPPLSDGDDDDDDERRPDEDVWTHTNDKQCSHTASLDVLVRDLAMLAQGPPQGDISLALKALDRLHMWLLTVQKNHIVQQFVVQNNVVETLLNFMYDHKHNGRCVDKTLKVLRYSIYVNDVAVGGEQVSTEMAVRIFQSHGIGILVQTLNEYQDDLSSHHSTSIFKTIWSILMDVIHDDAVVEMLKSLASSEYRGLVLYAVQFCLDHTGGSYGAWDTYIRSGDAYMSTSSGTTMLQILATVRILLESDDRPDSPTRLMSAKRRIVPKCLDVILTNSPSFSQNEALWEDAITLCLKCVSSWPDDELSQSLIGYGATTSSLAPFVTEAVRTFPRNSVIQGTSCLLVEKGCNCRSPPQDDCVVQDAFSLPGSFLLLEGAYPCFSRPVKSSKEPSTPLQKRFDRWQECVRKDIERAFGALQRWWKDFALPLYPMCMDRATDVNACSIVLHNMCVGERIMGGVYTGCDPGKEVEDGGIDDMLDDLLEPVDEIFDSRFDQSNGDIYVCGP